MDKSVIGRFLAQNSETVKLRRPSGKGIFIDVVVLARVTLYRPEQLVGGIIQGDRNVIIGNAEIAEAHWPGPPRVGDFILLDGGKTTLTIRSSDPGQLDGVIVRHDIQARGT